MEKFQVNWICEAPSHYNDYLFSELSSVYKNNFIVHFKHSDLKSHPWKNNFGRNFKYRYYNKKLIIDWFLLKQSLIHRKKIFVIGGWNDITTILVLIILSLRKSKFIIWTDTPDEVVKKGYIFPIMHKIYINFIFNKAAYVMGTGKKAVSVLKNMGCSEKKIINFPYFIDIDNFKIEKIIKRNNQLVFLSSGRLINDVKGYDNALIAFSKIHKKFPKLNFKYKIAGVGPDLINLKNLIEECNISEFVEFVGWLEAQELRDFYKSGDIFIHPAHVEPYGVAVIEAMASGLPIIGSTKTGAVVDRVIDNYNGLIFESGNIDQLYEKIYYLISNPDQIVNFGIKSRITSEEWPMKRGVEKLSKIIN